MSSHHELVRHLRVQAKFVRIWSTALSYEWVGAGATRLEDEVSTVLLESIMVVNQEDAL